MSTLFYIRDKDAPVDNPTYWCQAAQEWVSDPRAAAMFDTLEEAEEELNYVPGDGEVDEIDSEEVDSWHD